MKNCSPARNPTFNIANVEALRKRKTAKVRAENEDPAVRYVVGVKSV